MKKGLWFLFAITLIVLAILPFFVYNNANTAAKLRAFILTNDVFRTKDSLAPSGKTNSRLLEEILSSDKRKYISVTKFANTPFSESDLDREISISFSRARDNDISLIYISTHGLLNEDDSFSFFLSDGEDEKLVSGDVLIRTLSRIRGTKIVIMDCCNSGALIGKGFYFANINYFNERLKKSGLSKSFAGGKIKFFVSAGAYEPSYIWTSSRASEGASHFVLALYNALSEKAAFKADFNRDGRVLMSELEKYLNLNYGLSTSYAYPANDDFAIIEYETPAKKASLTISDFEIESRSFSKSSREISFSYRLNKAAKIGYQLIYQSNDGWNFNKTQLIRAEELDDEADTPGFKEVTLEIKEMPSELHGFVHLQLVEIDGKKLRPLNGTLLAVLAQSYEEAYIEVPKELTLSQWEKNELPIAISYFVPFKFRINILNSSGERVASPFIDEITRPHNFLQEGMLLYYDCKNSKGEMLKPGLYQVELVVDVENGEQQRILSEKIRISNKS